MAPAAPPPPPPLSTLAVIDSFAFDENDKDDDDGVVKVVGVGVLDVALVAGWWIREDGWVDVDDRVGTWIPPFACTLEDLDWAGWLTDCPNASPRTTEPMTPFFLTVSAA